MCISSALRHKSITKDSHGIATMTEYMLLLGLALATFIALDMAFSTFTATARADTMALEARLIALTISNSVTDVVGPGDTAAMRMIELPGHIGGMPYFVYPSPDGRNICVLVDSGHRRLEHRAPLLLPAEDIRVAGFLASPSRWHAVAYDAAARMVTLS